MIITAIWEHIFLNYSSCFCYICKQTTSKQAVPKTEIKIYAFSSGMLSPLGCKLCSLFLTKTFPFFYRFEQKGWRHTMLWQPDNYTTAEREYKDSGKTLKLKTYSASISYFLEKLITTLAHPGYNSEAAYPDSCSPL